MLYNIYIIKYTIFLFVSKETPGMNSSVKLNSLNAMYHRIIIGFEASLINNKFRWSVRILDSLSHTGAIVSTYST